MSGAGSASPDRPTYFWLFQLEHGSYEVTVAREGNLKAT